MAKKADILETLTDNLLDTETFIASCRKGMSEFINLVLAVETCEETGQFSKGMTEGIKGSLYDFKYDLDTLIEALEKRC